MICYLTKLNRLPEESWFPSSKLSQESVKRTEKILQKRIAGWSPSEFKPHKPAECEGEVFTTTLFWSLSFISIVKGIIKHSLHKECMKFMHTGEDMPTWPHISSLKLLN